ncbi:MAG: hypothetical protein HY855_05560 [Burkholderiales bacterium]|nr:hypothetical protein [Burkholderiales bacterium]
MSFPGGAFMKFSVGAASPWASLRPGGTVAAYHRDMAGGGFPLQPIVDAVHPEGGRSQQQPATRFAALRSG